MSAPLWVELDLADDVAVYGAKAARLGALTRLGVLTPGGLAMSASALTQTWRQNGLEHWIEALDEALAQTPIDALDALSQQVHDALMSASLPARLSALLQELGEDETRCWIVRSSGVGEDGASASFAGQLTSILDVRGAAALADAVRRCWASAWSSSSLSYQLMRGQRLGGVGVIIQPMYHPKLAGVLFTRAPDDQRVRVLEFVQGHAEALVQGEVTPARLSWPVGEASGAQGDEASLSLLPAHQRIAIEAIASTLERAFDGKPQDVEWLIDQEDRLVIVQSRDITTLSGAPPSLVWTRLRDDGARQLVWSNANMIENYPEPVCALLYSIARRGYQRYFEGLGQGLGVTSSRVDAVSAPLSQIVGVHHGRLYYTLSFVHECIRAAPLGDWLSQSWDGFIGVEQGVQDRPAQLDVASLTELIKMVTVSTGQLARLSSKVDAFVARVDAYAQALEPDVLSTKPFGALVEGLDAFMAIREQGWFEASLADTATTVSLALLKAIVARANPEDLHATISGLLEGIEGLISAQGIELLWQLAQLAKGYPQWLSLVEQEQWSLADALMCTPAAQPLRQAFEGYLQDWGFRSGQELTLLSPGMQEQPQVLARLVLGFVRRDQRSPASLARDQIAQREALMQQLVQRYRAQSGVALWPGALALAVRATHGAIAQRERARHAQAKLYYRFRRLVLELGARWQQVGVLAGAEDVFDLTFEELRDLGRSAALYPEAYAQIAAARRAARQAASALPEPPQRVTLPQGHYLSEPIEASPAPPAQEGALTGQIASRGQAVGVVRVAKDLAQASALKPGEILVTLRTDPGWGPLFFIASGLILERGGMLSHGAILARELGVPALVDVAGAMQRLQTGQHVRLDAQRGTIEILDDP